MSRLLPALLSVLLVACVAAWAQEGGIQNSTKADLKYESSKKSEFDNLVHGKEKATAKDVAVLDLGAKYYAYRLQWNAYRDDPIELTKRITELKNDVITPLMSSSKTSPETLKYLGPQLYLRYKEVLDLDFVNFRTSVLHAALCLPELARLKQDDIGKLLTEVAADKDRHDAVKLHAFKGMREYFPLQPITDDDDLTVASIKARKARDTARVEALTNFIEMKRPTPSDKGELDAIRFVRREAIQTLAQAQAPAVAALKKKGEVEGGVAPTLMRVLIKDGIEPEPSLQEKIEAALGLCHLKVGSVQAYEPEMGVYLVGRLLDEFVRTYSGEWGNLKKQVPRVAWKIQSERLRLGLEEMEKNCKETKAAAAAARIRGAAVGQYLNKIKDHGGVEGPGALRGVADKDRPKTNTLFKGFKNAAEIDPGE